MKIINSEKGRAQREVRKYFNEIASSWDSMRKEFYSEAVRQKIISMIYPEPGDIIADIGAGTGFITEGLLKTPASIVAIDNSKEMISRMRSKFSQAHNISYHIGDANRLPARDNFFNYALANMYLHHVTEPQRAIREIFRVLKGGGKMVITDLEAHEFGFLRKEHHDVWPGFKHETIREWMTEAGFKNVSVDSIEEYCCADSVKPGKNARLSIFMAAGEKP